MTGLTFVAVPGGEFLMGSDRFYPDEGPVHRARVGDVEFASTPVTNRQFAAFVAATGYVTVAERALSAAQFPDLPDADRAPGALVFTPTRGPVDLRNWRAWWRWEPGASWGHPGGTATDPGELGDRQDHPVVQVSFEDALAYCAWSGTRLPTEAEWERAARGGLEGATFAWGEQPRPDGELMANHWQGRFPYENTGARGWRGTSPVGTFPVNGYGLADMIGNVWEWTSDAYHDRHREPVASCCAPSAPNAAAERADGALPRMVLKGGSHLCAPEYCLRYRPAARSPQAVDTATSHIGFRVVRTAQATNAPVAADTQPE